MRNITNNFFDHSKNVDNCKNYIVNIGAGTSDTSIKDVIRDLFNDAEDVQFEEVDDYNTEEDFNTEDDDAKTHFISEESNPERKMSNLDGQQNKPSRGRPKAKPFRDYIDANQYDVEALIKWLRNSFAKAADTPEGKLIYLMAVRHCFKQQPAFSSFKKEFGYRFSSPTYITKEEWSGADHHRFSKSEIEKLKPQINILANLN